MAYIEVVLTEAEAAAGNSSYVKFEAIGDKFAGIFLSAANRETTFPGQTKSKVVTDYVFKNREGTFTLTAPFDLDRQLKSALANAALSAPDMRRARLLKGSKVAIVFTGEVAPTDPGKSAMKKFKVLIDSDQLSEGLATAAAAPKPPPPAPKPPPPSAGSEFDDIPY